MKIINIIILFSFILSIVIIQLLIIIFGHKSENLCPIPGVEDRLGFFSKKLGSVMIDGELCEIIETYEHVGCLSKCNDEFYSCQERTLTRLTRCPFGENKNIITYTNDKFHKEQVN